MASRQWSKARKVVFAYLVLLALVIASASTFVALYGPGFFVFRENGTGVTQVGPTDQQKLAQLYPHSRTLVKAPPLIKISCVEDPGDRIICIDKGPIS
jgi:hypothetical protein